MSTSDLPALPEDADALAAEFVLRLLGPEEEAACAERVARDPAFAAAVLRWQASFAVLDAEFSPMPPPPGLLAQVEARLFGKQASLPARLWASAGFWRGVAAAAVAAAVAFAVIGGRTERMELPPLVATVAPAADNVELVALLDRRAGTLRFTRLAGAAGPGRSLELWLLPEGATAPVSLGVVPTEPRFAVPLPTQYADRVAPGAAILVSDEVAGGSPTGQPQGAVLAQGRLAEL